MWSGGVAIAAALVALVALIEGVVLWRLSKALAAVARFGERLAHLASALELLTDTTEAGLTNVARELERSAPTRAAQSTRGATARRIAGAARRGKAPAEIASSEGLSESEVRLHLQMSKAKGGKRGAVRN
jgi:hypothetical protein